MMTDRIQRALDGELPCDQLSPEEVELYLRYQGALDAARQPIERWAAIDVTSAVLRRIAAPGLTAPGRPAPGRLRRALDAVAGWLWSPRPISLTVRPAFAMAGALAVAAALVWRAAPARTSSGAPGTLTTPTAARGAAPARVLVQFRLGAAAAHEVALVGDFNGWRPGHQLHQIAAGVWSVEVALEPGVYNYGFMIDGKLWQLDPLAPQVTDGFGGASSRMTVLPPEVRS